MSLSPCLASPHFQMFMVQVLTALFAVLNPISFQLSCAHPLRRPPLQRDSGVAYVINAQPNGLASRS